MKHIFLVALVGLVMTACSDQYLVDGTTITE